LYSHNKAKYSAKLQADYAPLQDVAISTRDSELVIGKYNKADQY